MDNQGINNPNNPPAVEPAVSTTPAPQNQPPLQQKVASPRKIPRILVIILSLIALLIIILLVLNSLSVVSLPKNIKNQPAKNVPIVSFNQPLPKTLIYPCPIAINSCPNGTTFKDTPQDHNIAGLYYQLKEGTKIVAITNGNLHTESEAPNGRLVVVLREYTTGINFKYIYRGTLDEKIANGASESAVLKGDVIGTLNGTFLTITAQIKPNVYVTLSSDSATTIKLTQ